MPIFEVFDKYCNDCSHWTIEQFIPFDGGSQYNLKHLKSPFHIVQGSLLKRKNNFKLCVHACIYNNKTNSIKCKHINGKEVYWRNAAWNRILFTHWRKMGLRKEQWMEQEFPNFSPQFMAQKVCGLNGFCKLCTTAAWLASEFRRHLNTPCCFDNWFHQYQHVWPMNRMNLWKNGSSWAVCGRCNSLHWEWQITHQALLVTNFCLWGGSCPSLVGKGEKQSDLTTAWSDISN